MKSITCEIDDNVIELIPIENLGNQDGFITKVVIYKDEERIVYRQPNNIYKPRTIKQRFGL